jgi:hypothetical protein
VLKKSQLCGQRTTDAGHCVGGENLIDCILLAVSIAAIPVVPCHVHVILSASLWLELLRAQKKS